MNSLVRDVMTTEVVAVEAWTPFKEIVARLAEHRISAVPVLDADGRVLGVVTEADLLLKQEHPDPEVDVPLAWSRRRRLERKKAAAVVAGKLMTTPLSPRRPPPPSPRRPGACTPPGSSGCRSSTKRAD
jgi:CBS-domain-containing membrane protein